MGHSVQGIGLACIISKMFYKRQYSLKIIEITTWQAILIGGQPQPQKPVWAVGKLHFNHNLTLASSLVSKGIGLSNPDLASYTSVMKGQF